MKKRVILKISGEALAGENKEGINSEKVFEIAEVNYGLLGQRFHILLKDLESLLDDLCH